MTTSIEQLRAVQALEKMAEKLHFKLELFDQLICFIPDQKHYPKYAERTRFGYCETVEEALGFLKGLSTTKVRMG